MQITKTDTNTLPVTVFKFYVDIFSPGIANLTKECFTKAVFPENLKTVSITPTLKKGDAKLASNYRTLCSLPYV